MKKFLNIFKFEFLTFMKNKVFVGITLFLIIAIGILLLFPLFSSLFSGSENEGNHDTRVIALSGLSNESQLSFFEEVLPDGNFKIVDDNIDTLKNDVEGDKYKSAIVIKDDLSYTYIVKDIELYDSTEVYLNEALKARYQSMELARLGATNNQIGDFMSADVESTVIQTSSGKNQAANFLYTYILIVALYMAILLYGQLVAMSVATEKSSRAMELLITSAKPIHLMFGKILGTGSAGLLQFVIIFGSGFAFYNMNASRYKDNLIIQSIFNMPIEILLFATLFFVLGFFIYAFMYGALGSLVSRVEQLNTSTLPVTFLFIIAFVVVVFSINSGNLDNTLIKVCSYVPFTSPMAMFVRIAMGNVEIIEIIISVAILGVSTLAVGYIAAGIYRIGVLMYGQPPKLKKLFSIIKSGK